MESNFYGNIFDVGVRRINYILGKGWYNVLFGIDYFVK